jgi:hypothetical protein
VPLVAAAVCPHPPLLVPDLAAGAAAELDELRLACDRAVSALLSAEPDRLVLVGVDSLPHGTTFAPWGVPVPAGASGPTAGASGPLSLQVGGPGGPLSILVGVWLLARAGARADSAEAVAADLDSAACVRLGAAIAAPGRVGLLVMGDGSGCRGVTAPGYDDPRAEPFDRSVVEALDKGDPAALLALDPALALELRAAGRAPWQVLAGAAVGRSWHGDLRYAAAPYGVAYFVASWEPA